MPKHFILLLLTVHIYEVTNLPSHLKISKEVIPLAVVPTPVQHNTIPSARKKKGPNNPLTFQIQHQFLVPNLHVIPLTNVHQVHENHHTNLTHSVIPVYIPIHNLVPVHDLTVIPLHRVSEQKASYRVNDEENVYRNPLGGYGVGWQFGGHGAGHGFHYSYYG